MPKPTTTRTTAERPNLYATVSAQIITELRNGSAPWVRPWSVDPGNAFPRNGLTHRRYQGNNIMLLFLSAFFNGYRSNEWFTYLQAKEAGGQVRGGEKATHILKAGRRRDDDAEPEAQPDEKQGKRPRTFIKTYAVFNRDQIDGLPEPIRAPGLPEAERIAHAEAFIAATGSDVTEVGDRASYWPGEDKITMPLFSAFKSAAHYYATSFHEHTHWTGARHRLDRLPPIIEKGSPAYAREELTAELGAAFLCAHFGIDGDLRHPGYIAHYIKQIEDDERAFFHAATAARQAVAYLFELTGMGPEEDDAETDDEAEGTELPAAA
jgi:antirestriction protein ArdC